MRNQRTGKIVIEALEYSVFKYAEETAADGSKRIRLEIQPRDKQGYEQLNMPYRSVLNCELNLRDSSSPIIFRAPVKEPPTINYFAKLTGKIALVCLNLVIEEIIDVEPCEHEFDRSGKCQDCGKQLKKSRNTDKKIGKWRYNYA